MVIEICKEISETLTKVSGKSWTFYDSELYEMNFRDSPEFPFVFLAHPLRGKGNKSQWGFDSANFNLHLMFVAQSKLSDNMEERKLNITNTMAGAQEFVKSIEDYEFTDSLSKKHTIKINAFEFEEFYNKFDVNADGIEAVINATISIPC